MRKQLWGLPGLNPNLGLNAPGGGYQPPPAYTGLPGSPVDTTPAAAPPATDPYAGLIAGDSIFKQLQADLSAQGIQDAAQRKAATDRALIQFGEVPDLQGTANGLGLNSNSPMYQMLFGDVDQATRQGANDLTNAGLSTVAELGKQHSTNLESLMSNLAARGVIRSGATGTGTNLEGQAYTKAQFQARSTLLDYLAGVQQAFNNSERDRQNQLRQGLTDATTRQIGLHPDGASAYGGGQSPYGQAQYLGGYQDPTSWGPTAPNRGMRDYGYAAG